MRKPQNVYDNSQFFEEYQKMRDSKINANELIEIPQIKAMMPDIKDKMILDLGCGDGGMSRYFAENGAKRVLGLDISNNMIKLAKSKTQQANVEYIVGEMENISKLNEKFDIVFSSLAFHYVEDFEKLMADISGLLKPNGILLFSQEHPIATAIIPSNKNMKKYIEINGKRYFLLSDYNNNSCRSLNWNIEGVIKYHRNFSSIINAIIKSGMSVLQVGESQADEKAVQLVEKYKYQIDRPYFLYIKAQKV